MSQHAWQQDVMPPQWSSEIRDHKHLTTGICTCVSLRSNSSAVGVSDIFSVRIKDDQTYTGFRYQILKPRSELNIRGYGSESGCQIFESRICGSLPKTRIRKTMMNICVTYNIFNPTFYTVPGKLRNKGSNLT